MDGERINRAGKVTEVPASEVKQTWHACLDRVSQAREEIVITRYGKPVARMLPLADGGGEEDGIFGCMSGTLTIHGDIVAPTGEEWNADAG